MTKITVEIDIGDISSDDLAKELEFREDKKYIPDHVRDDVYSLYRDFIEYDSNYMSSELFTDRLKKFFGKYNRY